MKAFRYLLPIPFFMAVYGASCRMASPGKPDLDQTVALDVRYAICAACLGVVSLLITAAIVKADSK